MTAEKKPQTFQKTAAAVTAAALIATPFIAGWEGKRNLTYRDIVGIPTACYGHTGADVKMGTRYTDAQCSVMLSRDVQAHMEPVLRCTPGLATRRYQLAAATSLTFNIGAGAYCKSTVARRFNAGDLRGACEGFMVWTRAGSNPRVPGLVNRRTAERKLCLTDL